MADASTGQAVITLWWTDALPCHYVAREADGAEWLIPVAPIGSGCWDRRVPYSGNYKLQRVAPTVMERFYQPVAGAGG